MAKLLVLHGPNLNLLGNREVSLYGHTTLEDLNEQLRARAPSWLDVECFQSNAEHALVDKLHQARGDVDMMLLNPGGLTHTSVVLRDACLAVEIPFIEVHLSNIQAREPFRHRSYFSDIAVGVISGFGPQSYILAQEAAITRLG